MVSSSSAAAVVGANAGVTSAASSNTGVIAGAAAGGAVLLLLCIALVVCLCRRRKQRHSDLPAVQPSPFSSMAVTAAVKALKGIQLHRGSTVDSNSSLVTQGSQLKLQQVDLAAVHHVSKLEAADDQQAKAVGVEMVGLDVDDAEADDEHDFDYHVTSRPYLRTHVAIGATVGATLPAALAATRNNTLRRSSPQLGPVDVSATGSVTDFSTVDEAGFVGNPLALPAVWKMYRDGNNRKFFYNTVTGVSEWTLPMGATLQSNADRE